MTPYFRLEEKRAKQIGTYLVHLSEQYESTTSELPLVVIIDSLEEEKNALGTIDRHLETVKYTKFPFIIATITWATANTPVAPELNRQKCFKLVWILICFRLFYLQMQ